MDLDLWARKDVPSNWTFFGDDEEDTEQSPPESQVPEETNIEDLPQVSGAQKRLIHKVHINTGHPPLERFLRALRAAGALPQVLRYVKEEYQCEHCNLKHRADNRHRAHFPQTFGFNKVVSVDFLYLPFKEQQVPVLNMVCTGTNYHVAVRAPTRTDHGGTPSAQTAWRTFAESWIRYLGCPEMIICDSGNEFKGVFERHCEQMGILQHVILPESPWQNAKAERHGGWLKNKLDAEISSGRCVFDSLAELDEYLAAITSTKNRWFCRGGFTPSQLVFGQMPRIPGELLSDDVLGLHGLRDAYEDPLQVDQAATEYRRSHEIRERAKQAALEQSSKDTIRKASHAAMHQSRHWRVGQWVYVFRRAKTNQELHLRNRWVGPGLVTLVNNQTVYVAMRSRLWRCSAEQLRAALPSELLGRELASDPGLAELVRRVTTGVMPGAVDVSKEGPPDNSSHFDPVERADEGIAASGPMPQLGEASQAPQPVDAVPPGLLPASSLSAPLPPMPVPQEDRPVVFVPAPPGLSAPSSRRTSVEEPAAEPGQEQPMEQDLPTIPEDGSDFDSSPQSSTGEATERPSKAARTEEETTPASAGESREVASSSDTRAPGTPVRRLLDTIPYHRRQASSHLTPGEDLEPDGRVQLQAREFEQLRQDHLPDDSDRSLAQFEAEGWSGNFFNYSLGDQTLRLQPDQTWSLMTKRGGEVTLKELNSEERKLFEASDHLEWQAILKTKAVRVVHGAEADALRKKYPDRILSSRMVHRRKPLDEVNKWKAKSRWCLHGHSDPDTSSLMTYAPTPQAESIMMFCQTGLNLGMKFAFGDVKNAFCQSNKLRRPRGPLFAEPCEGLSLPPGSLIIIEVPVYGLDDAPASWRLTVTSFLVESLQFQRNLVEPCWFSYFDLDSGKCTAQLLVEVDDFIIAASPETYDSLRKSLTERFEFGKWDESTAEYAGRRIRCFEDRILVDQYKYIHEQVFPIQLPRGRKQDKNEPLTKDEFDMLRSLIFKISWIGRESRPEAAGLSSILASKLPCATIGDILNVNKFVNQLRSTADRPLTIWRFHPDSMCFVVCSDAGGINVKGDTEILDSEGLPTDATQGAWIVLTTSKLPEGTEKVKASPMTWRSSKLKRKVFSTFGGETQAMLQGINEVDWLQIMYRDAVQHDVSIRSWRNSLSPHMVVMRGECRMGGRQQQCSVTDAKSLYDCLLKENPSGKQDRKSSLELAIILRDLQETRSMIRWVPHQKMPIDALTKEDPSKANDALNHLLKTGWLSLVDVEDELKARKSDASFRRRSQHASRQRLTDEYVEQMNSFLQSLWSMVTGGDVEFYHCLTRHHLN